MDLENQTPFPALLFRSGMSDDRMAASVLCRVTYDLINGSAVVSDDQPWDVSTGPWECDYGDMDSDEVFFKGGVDVFVFGSARAPSGTLVEAMYVDVEVGVGFRYRLAVFGERVWEQGASGLVASRPQPFDEVALTLANAYGGADQWDGLDVAYPSNPAGKGYYLEEENALGRPLPNIESPDERISTWDDHPEPVGVSQVPMTFGPRLDNGLVFDERTGGLSQLKPEFFNAAFPRMIAPAVNPGDRVTLRGVRAEGELGFDLPSLDLEVEVTLGDSVERRGLAIDQVGIEPDTSRVFISYRYPFRYGFIPLQQRACVLRQKATEGE